MNAAIEDGDEEGFADFSAREKAAASAAEADPSDLMAKLEGPFED